MTEREKLIEVMARAIGEHMCASDRAYQYDYQAARDAITAIEANHYTIRLNRPAWLASLTIDQLYEEAVRACRASGRPQVSVSLIQRMMLLGYGQAATLIDRMEAEGVCSAPDHAGRRLLLKAESTSPEPGE